MSASLNKGKLLIVDDDKNILKMLSRIFFDLYFVKEASSGQEALEILLAGFEPGVILSDQNMPQMKGSEFLERSIRLVPNATRIILTAYSNPKDIISCINQGHAWMFISKPFERVELIQAIKLAFDRHHVEVQNQELMTELKSSNSQLKGIQKRLNNLIFENKSLFIQLFQAVSDIISLNEKYYFTPHNISVATISNEIAKSMNLNESQVTNIVLSSLLHSSVMLTLPEKLAIYDPWDLEFSDMELYFGKFSNGLRSLARTKEFRYNAKIIGQMFERQDGSGFPNNIKGNDLLLESQIVSISNMYHNLVFRFTKLQLSDFKETGIVVQKAEQTIKRHKEAMKFFRENSSWFNISVLKEFQELAKTPGLSVLIPELMDYKIMSDEKAEAKEEQRGETESESRAKEVIETANREKETPVEIVEDVAEEKPAEEKKALSESKGADSLKFNFKKNKDKEKKAGTEAEVSISELKSGYKVLESVATSSGMVVVRTETILDNKLIARLQELEGMGMISSFIHVEIPESEVIVRRKG